VCILIPIIKLTNVDILNKLEPTKVDACKLLFEIFNVNLNPSPNEKPPQKYPKRVPRRWIHLIPLMKRFIVHYRRCNFLALLQRNCPVKIEQRPRKFNTTRKQDIATNAKLPNYPQPNFIKEFEAKNQEVMIDDEGYVTQDEGKLISSLSMFS
jgi:hypothetical protein